MLAESTILPRSFESELLDEALGCTV